MVGPLSWRTPPPAPSPQRRGGAEACLASHSPPRGGGRGEGLPSSPSPLRGGGRGRGLAGQSLSFPPRSLLYTRLPRGPEALMIDTHVHVVPPGLPGVGPLGLRPEGGAAEVAARLRDEMAAAGVGQALAMGAWNAGPDDPLGVNETLQLARAVPGLHAVGVADPLRNDPDHLRRVEAVLASGQVKALKAYLGYLHYPPDHPGYVPYYELAGRFKLPVVFHTGDTYSPQAKVRFAHPLLVDDVAVDHPNVRFVLAHVGNPWLIDAAE